MLATMALLVTLGCQSQTPPRDTTPSITPSSTPMQDINLSSFTGKPLQELLDAVGGYDRFIFVDNGRPGILGGANFLFGEKWLVVKINDITLQPRFNMKYAWDLELLKKELVTSAAWD